MLLQVLESFKRLHRTREMVFQDDSFALQGMILLHVYFFPHFVFNIKSPDVIVAHDVMTSKRQTCCRFRIAFSINRPKINATLIIP
jgi:hypothetical protein